MTLTLLEGLNMFVAGGCFASFLTAIREGEAGWALGLGAFCALNLLVALT